MQRVTQTLIKWMPSGIGLGATLHYLRHQAWTEALLLSFLTACTSLWVRFSGKFMETLEEEAARRGEVSAQWFLRTADNLALSVISNFRHRYYQSLIYALRDYRTQGVKTKGPFTLNLEKVFIPLRLAPETLDKISSAVIPLRGAMESLEIWDFIARLSEQPAFRRIVVLGPPGSGKSTLLEHLTLTYAQRIQHHHHPKMPAFIPVLLYLRDHQEAIASDAPPTLLELVEQQESIKSLNPPADWFAYRFRQGKCLVMLDGLDEVADAETRKTVSRWVDQQILNYPLTPFILTSRPFGYRSAPLQQAGIVIEVQPFTLKQVQQFIRNWYLQNEIMRRLGNDDPGVRAIARQQADDLFGRIRHNPSLAAMALNPLLLTMIATVHCFRGALPGRRIELYAEICDVLLGRRQDAKGLTETLTASQKKSVLQVLALKRMLKKSREFKVVTGCLLIREKLITIAGKDAEPEKFLGEIENVSGLLVQRQPGVYEFAHKSFQEYLAAVQIKEINQDFLLTRHIDDPWWDETIRLYAAQSDASALIWAAINKSTVTALTLAYDCLEEGLSVQSDVRRELENTLENGLESDNPEIFKLAAEVKLSRRLTKLLRIDELTEIDTSYISCAEYQLFIDEKQLEGEMRQPDHWGHSRFQSGDALKPITGVRVSDAEEFCDWLTQRCNPIGDTFLEGDTSIFVGEFRFRLPTFAEVHDHPIAPKEPVTCWCNAGDQQILAEVDEEQWRGWREQLSRIVTGDRPLSRDLNRALTQSPGGLAQPGSNYPSERVFAPGMRFLDDQSEENLLDLYNISDGRTAIGRLYQALRPSSRTLDLNLDLDFVRFRIPDFESMVDVNIEALIDQNLKDIIAIARERDRALNRQFVIQRGHDLRELRSYLLLLSALFSLLAETYTKLAKSRGLFPTQKPTRKECEEQSRKYTSESAEAFNLYAFLVMVEERRSSQFPVWESIRLVKQKNTAGSNFPG